MKKLTLLAIFVLLFASFGCGGPSPSSLSPTISASSKTPSSPIASSSSPTPQAEGEELFPPYPGANQISKAVTTDSGPSGQTGTVTVYLLTTSDPYEKVKVYYQKIIPEDWKDLSTSEATDEEGAKTSLISAQSPSEDMWVHFVISMSEDNVVSINHLVGRKGEATTEVTETGKVKPYPKAEVIDSSQYSGTGPNGQEANWSMISLSTTDSYEKVKAYYQVNTPPEFVKVFDQEEKDDDGRSYVLMLQSADQTQFYAIYIQENLEAGTVEITHNYGKK